MHQNPSYSLLERYVDFDNISPLRSDCTAVELARTTRCLRQNLLQQKHSATINEALSYSLGKTRYNLWALPFCSRFFPICLWTVVSAFSTDRKTTCTVNNRLECRCRLNVMKKFITVYGCVYAKVLVFRQQERIRKPNKIWTIGTY